MRRPTALYLRRDVFELTMVLGDLCLPLARRRIDARLLALAQR